MNETEAREILNQLEPATLKISSDFAKGCSVFDGSLFPSQRALLSLNRGDGIRAEVGKRDVLICNAAKLTDDALTNFWIGKMMEQTKTDHRVKRFIRICESLHILFLDRNLQSFVRDPLSSNPNHWFRQIGRRDLITELGQKQSHTSTATRRVEDSSWWNDFEGALDEAQFRALFARLAILISARVRFGVFYAPWVNGTALADITAVQRVDANWRASHAQRHFSGDMFGVPS